MLPLMFQGFFPTIVTNLQNLGFFLYLFPFLLSLAIIYGVLSFAAKEQLPKSARGLIAIILSFFVMLYAGANPGIVGFFANLTGGGLILLSGILFVIILLGLAGVPMRDLVGEKPKNKAAMWAIIIFIIFLGILLFTGAGVNSFVPLPSWVTTGEFLTILFFVFIIAIAVWWLGSEKEKEEAEEAAPSRGPMRR